VVGDVRDLTDHKKQLLEEIRERREYLQFLDGLREKYPRTLPAEYVFEKMLQKRARREDALPTGVEWWDEFAGPLRRGNVYVIAGYPGAGKTTLAINLAWGFARRGIPTWYYCLELMAEEVFEVLGGHIMKKAVLSDADETQAYAVIQPSGFRFFDPGGYMPWQKHLEVVSDNVRQQKIQVLFIDNFGFLARVGKNTYETENMLSSRIKGLAQELEIPIVLIHHLRKPESDEREPKPTAHAMRGSSAVLADASDAFVLHHPLSGDEIQSRQPVGYILSGKPRWGLGGLRYVRLEGSQRTYYPAVSSEFRDRKGGAMNYGG